MKRKLILMLWIALLGIGSTNAQHRIIPRGSSPGEFYNSSTWYYLDGERDWSMIIFTEDYGKSFQQKYLYELDFNNESDSMPIGFLYVDASPGVLYNHNIYGSIDFRGLYRSFDDGENWEKIETPGSTGEFATGNIENEIFKISQGAIYKSIDNGDNWTQMHDYMIGGIEVGSQPQEIYIRSTQTISHSLNDGQDFDSFPLDSTVTGIVGSGFYPAMTRGIIPGELYYISWWLEPARFKIFRSTDHGQSFQLQFEMPESWDIYNFSYKFGAGRGEGEFYIVQGTAIDRGVGDFYARIHVHHSDDYAQSFKEYVHDFDENWTENTRTIFATSHPEGWGTVSGAANYTLGETATLTATPYEGYEFKEWTEHGESVSDNPVYSFEVTETRNLVANFQLVNTISNPQSAVEINIYPNPATGQAILSIPNVSSFKNSTIHIINLYGQTVKIISIKEKQTQIDLTDLPAGSYLYRLTADGIIIKTGKLIIN